MAGNDDAKVRGGGRACALVHCHRTVTARAELAAAWCCVWRHVTCGGGGTGDSLDDDGFHPLIGGGTPLSPPPTSLTPDSLTPSLLTRHSSLLTPPKKVELMEVVDFFRKPEKFRASGARPPKGVLLVGPPGATCVDIKNT